MTIIGIVLLVAGLVVGAALTLADPVLLSRIGGEHDEGVAENRGERLPRPWSPRCYE
jgi:hypothetical protein